MAEQEEEKRMRERTKKKGLLLKEEGDGIGESGCVALGFAEPCFVYRREREREETRDEDLDRIQLHRSLFYLLFLYFIDIWCSVVVNSEMVMHICFIRCTGFFMSFIHLVGSVGCFCRFHILFPSKEG